MNIKNIIKINTLIISFLAFTNTSKAMHKDTKSYKSKISNPTKIKTLVFGRAGCFGTCPTYVIQINETGKLYYKGVRYTEYLGTYTKTVSSQDVIGFLKEFNKIHPDTLHYKYETKIADLPGFYYFIHYPDTVKKVINADAGPKILKIWGQKIDSFINIDNSWQKTTEDVNF